MSQGKRPGGLTALAVINFVFCGLALLGVLAFIALVALMGAMEMEGADGDRARNDIELAGGMGWIWLSIIISGVNAVLLLISGIGYLKQKLVMGRYIGTAYALSSLVFSAAYGAMVRFEFGSLVGIVYPVLTLVLLNTTFKDDLVN